MEATDRGMGGTDRQPLLVAADAATRPASVAVLRGETVLARLAAPDRDPSDAWLLGAIHEALARSGAGLAEVQGFAVTVGPGTFTGVRVGLATCLGLAAPRSLPVAGVVTLEALAEIGRRHGPWVAACLDARRQRVYAALYHLRQPPLLPVAAVWGPGLCEPAAFRDRLDRCPSAPVLVGSGAPLLGLPAGAAAPGDGIAAAAGALVARSWRRGPGSLPPPRPLYLRPPDARRARSPLLEPGT